MTVHSHILPTFLGHKTRNGASTMERSGYLHPHPKKGYIQGINQHCLNIDSSATPCDIESSTTRLDHLVPLRSPSSPFNQHQSRTRLYHVSTLLKLLGVDGWEAYTQDKQKVQILSRVSSSHQKTAGDLQRHIDDLLHAYPGHQVLSDVGSGLNYKRKGLQTLLDTHAPEVDKAVMREVDCGPPTRFRNLWYDPARPTQVSPVIISSSRHKYMIHCLYDSHRECPRSGIGHLP